MRTDRPETNADHRSAEASAERLVALGLTPNQARIYLSLLTHGVGSAGEVAEHSGVPRTKVYDALQSLERMGFCSARGSRVSSWEPVAPEIALSEWRHAREAERNSVTELEKVICAELIQELPANARAPATTVTFMEALIGRESAASMFERLVSASRERLDIVQAAPLVQERNEWNTFELDAVARGVVVRVLCTPETAADPRRYEALLNAGCDVRVSSTFGLKLVLRDGAEAMVALRDPSAEAADFTAVRITHPELVAPLQVQFQREWRRATPVTTQEVAA